MRPLDLFKVSSGNTHSHRPCPLLQCSCHNPRLPSQQTQLFKHLPRISPSLQLQHCVRKNTLKAAKISNQRQKWKRQCKETLYGNQEFAYFAASWRQKHYQSERTKRFTNSQLDAKDSFSAEPWACPMNLPASLGRILRCWWCAARTA